MAIKEIPGGGGGTIITGKEDINLFRLMALRGALKLEIKGLRHSGGSVAARVKREFGFKGNKAAVYAKLDAMVEAIGKERLTTAVTGQRPIH